jgi:SAM-dependent methyltransferase
MINNFIKKLLGHRQTQGLALDDPSLTILRKTIIRKNVFLREIYCEWYKLLRGALSNFDFPSLEIGSGAGFLSEFIPNLFLSDILPVHENHLTCDALHLPFNSLSLNGIFFTNVLHHIPDAGQFFKEASRVLKPGGVIGMIEPWVTPWSTWVYTHLHHEGFKPDSIEWVFPSSGPLSGANSALPWTIFYRDISKFRKIFPEFHEITIKPMMPILYLVSGGVSMRPLVPFFSFPFFKWLDGKIIRWKTRPAMFALIILRKST